MVVSNKDPLKTDMVKCDITTHKNETLTLGIPFADNYFVFDKSRLYYLNNADTKLVVEIDFKHLKF